MIDRWLLPGPAAFMKEAFDTLAQWSNLVVACPAADAAVVHDGIERALRTGEREWRVGGPVAAGVGHPIHELVDALGVRREGDVRLTPAALVERLREYQVVLVHGVEGANWQLWKAFLAEYEQAVRGVSEFQRTVIVAVVGGVAQADMCKRAPALRTLVWDGIVGELDALTYFAMARRRRSRAADRRERLIARMICKLANGDIDLADALMNLDERELFDPAAAIRRAGVERAGSGRAPSWETGELVTVDGESMLHSAVLLRDGDPEGVLQMRLWAAQAAEILPVLELNRRWLAQRMRSSGLRLPVTLGDEVVEDIDELEIGQLALLARKHRLSGDIQRLANKWRRVRNKLAHLEPLSADEALDDELLPMPASLRPRMYA